MAEPSNVEKPAEAQAEPEIEIEIVDAEPSGEDTAAGGDKAAADKADGDEAEQGETAEQAAERKGKPPHRTAKGRIAELTRERHELERQLAWERNERERLAQEMERRNAELTERMAKLESTYTADTTATRIAQAETQVETQLAVVKAKLKQAAEDANHEALADANAELAQLNAAKTQIAAFKAQHEREKTKPREEPKQEQERPQFDPQHIYLMNKWVGENGWFRDPRHAELSVLARAVDARMTAERQFDPRTEAYYQELSRRLEPHLLAAGVKEPDEPEPKPQQTQTNRPPITAAVAGVTRTAPASSNPNKVTLTPEEVQIAEKLGVSLKAFAAQKLRREQRIASQ